MFKKLLCILIFALMSQSVYSADRPFRFEGVTYKSFEEFKNSSVYAQIKAEQDLKKAEQAERERISEEKHQKYLSYLRDRNRYSGGTMYWMHEDMRRKERESQILPSITASFKLDEKSPIYPIVSQISKELGISHEEVIRNYSAEIKRRIQKEHTSKMEEIKNYPNMKQTLEKIKSDSEKTK